MCFRSVRSHASRGWSVGRHDQGKACDTVRALALGTEMREEGPQGSRAGQTVSTIQWHRPQGDHMVMQCKWWGLLLEGARAGGWVPHRSATGAPGLGFPRVPRGSLPGAPCGPVMSTRAGAPPPPLGSSLTLVHTYPCCRRLRRCLRHRRHRCSQHHMT